MSVKLEDMRTLVFKKPCKDQHHEAGKVMKPDSYSPPDLLKCLYDVGYFG